MTETISDQKPLPLPRFAVLAFGILLLLWAVGGYPTWRLGGEAALPAMVVGGLLAYIASLVGVVPLVLKRGKAPVEKIPAAMGAMALRVAVVVVLAVAVVLLSGLDKNPLLLWVAISHFGLLVADTLFARGELRAS